MNKLNSLRNNFGLVAFIALVSVSNSYSLPWDTDMNKQQSYQPGEIARAIPENTVPYGSTDDELSGTLKMTLEESEKLVNPVKSSHDSIQRGKRYYSMNCITCHGEKGDGAGPVGPQVGAPSLLTDLYKNRPEGRIFGVIKLGGTAMPRYGYKLSVKEIWDTVNYVRYLQSGVK